MLVKTDLIHRSRNAGRSMTRLSSIQGLVARSLEVDASRRRAPSCSSTASVAGRATATSTRGSSSWLAGPHQDDDDDDDGRAMRCSSLQRVHQPSYRRHERTGRARGYHHHDAAPFKNAAAAASSYDPRRNRFTQGFGAMLDDAACRRAIERYADCVKGAQQQSDEGLTRHACQHEFDAVKDCWRHARQQLRRAGRRER
jgi:hypothetical protein